MSLPRLRYVPFPLDRSLYRRDFILTYVQKANNAWSIARLWILLFLIQSSLVAVAFHMLPTSGQFVLLTANALAYIWSTTVMCEMLHVRYVAGNTEEQELHDLMGGLIG